uniref:ShKT domain-containing protein n=1 Tax=Rhabditophanes sp. KR3021 TaxID=114890 RepID=A0AC35U8N8_9BILA
MKNYIFILFGCTIAYQFLILGISGARRLNACRDKDINCFLNVAEDPGRCSKDDFITENCLKACHLCNNNTIIPPEYDLLNVPPNLRKVAFLIGKWRSEFGGKVDFPTIPIFTYGEELDFRICNLKTRPSLNYTAFAWDAYDKDELHTENGYVTANNNGTNVALTTVMSNGFATVEEGTYKDNSIEFRLQRIGRVNFSRDLPVRMTVRSWILVNETHLESSVVMSTQTHPMILHTTITYVKIYP